MKKMLALLALAPVLTMSVTALAESANTGSNLGAIVDQLLSSVPSTTDASGAAQAAAPASDLGPEVRIEDAFYEKVRASAFLRDGEYSDEINVFIELKNVSGKTLYPDDAAITAYSASGAVLDTEEYCYCEPSMVENGGSFFVWDNFYDPDFELSEVGYFVVTVESDTSSYRTYAVLDATAEAGSGIASAFVTNAADAPIYGIDATVVVSDANGAILDVCNIGTGNAVGIGPGGTMILRANVEDHATDDPLMAGEAEAHVIYQPE